MANHDPAARNGDLEREAALGEGNADLADRRSDAAADLVGRHPVLDLVVDRTLREGRIRLEYELDVGDPAFGINRVRACSRPTERSLQEAVDDLFREIQELRVDSARHRTYAGQDLAAKGVLLAEELIPDTIAEHLRCLAGRLLCLHLQSEDPFVPWELIRIPCPKEGEREAFLCEAFAVARWRPGTREVARLRLSRLALIVPREPHLGNTILEAEELRTLLATHCRVDAIEPRYEMVLEALASGCYDAFHFTGHGLARGADPNRWAIYLEGREPLTPEVVYAHARGLGGSRPLVFLNACHTGKAGFSITRRGGWSEMLLAAGAGAFLGSHWAVRDDRAREFAVDFYRRLVEGMPIALAVRGARLGLRGLHPGDPTWLAYVLFAHPLAALADGERTHTAREAAEGRTSPPGPHQAPAIGDARTAPEPVPRAVSRRAAAPGGYVYSEHARTAPDSASPGHRPTPREEPARPAMRAHAPSPGAGAVVRPRGARSVRRHEPDGTILLYVPGGTYTMGAEEVHEWTRPPCTVVLSSFWIAKFPVTNAQYARFLDAVPGRRPPEFWDDARFNAPRQPVVGIAWAEAQAYCAWAGLRLPTEAEWEAAVRGADGRRFPWGEAPPTPALANFRNHVGASSPVGNYPAGAGPFGTLDQAGNVWEWCLDPWSPTAYHRRQHRELDPVAVADPAVRAVRGGAWLDSGDKLQGAIRQGSSAKLRLNSQGFRCVWIQE